MNQYPDKKIIFIMGTLGAGKGTQAEKLADAFNLRHFDTGTFLKELFASGDSEIEKEKKLYESGKWMSPEFVARKVLEKTTELLADDNFKGLVFSGSPRTIYEAEQEIPFFEKLVGKNNIKVFYLDISEQASISRSAGRLICEKNSHPIPNFPEYRQIRENGTCPQDGSRLMKKNLDDPEILKKRLMEHNNRTLPVLSSIKKMGYEIIKINGEQSIEAVTNEILKYLQ